MSSPVTLTATTATDSGAMEWTIPGGPWNNTNKIFDNAMGSAATTAVLTFGGFGSAGILPANATVVGIQLTGFFWAQTSSTSYPFDVELSVGSKASGNCVGTPAALGTTAGGGITFGASNAFPGTMTAPSVADVNGGSMAATFEFSGPSGGPGMSEIFSSGSTVEIWYTTPANQVLPQCITVKPVWVERD